MLEQFSVCKDLAGMDLQEGEQFQLCSLMVLVMVLDFQKPQGTLPCHFNMHKGKMRGSKGTDHFYESGHVNVCSVKSPAQI